MSTTAMNSKERIQKALQDGDMDAYEREAQSRFWTGVYLLAGWIAAWWVSLAIIVWFLSE
ncbi:MAG: hypothetical protein QNJ62_07480 [Methyloceanibacter sp.]|nr:hypothetical protein [Methyloceanibacter sp.]